MTERGPLVLLTDVPGLVLRELVEPDISAIVAYRRANVEYHREFNIGEPPTDESDIRAWLGYSIQLDFGLWLEANLVGICDLGFWRESDEGLIPVPVDAEGELVGGVGYNIDRAQENNGYTTAAVNALVAYAFSLASVGSMRSKAMTPNIASRRVLEKAGFTVVEADEEWCAFELRR